MCDVKFTRRANAQVVHGIGRLDGESGILAVDPGGTTGLAWVIDGEVCVAQIGGLEPNHMAAVVVGARRMGFPVRMVMEDFALDPHGAPGGRDGLSPVRVAAGVCGILAYNGLLRNEGGPFGSYRPGKFDGARPAGVTLEWQMPALAKSSYPDVRMERAGMDLGKMGPMPHAKDALRHLLTSVKSGGIQKEE